MTRTEERLVLEAEITRLRERINDWRDLYWQASERADREARRADEAIRKRDAQTLREIRADREAEEPRFAFTIDYPDGNKKAGRLSELLGEGGILKLTASDGTHIRLFRDGEHE